MPCKSCGSVNQSKFTAEMAIHFPGLQNIDKPVVWVFPELVVCLDCGTPNSLCRKLSCVNLRKAMPLRRVDSELSLPILLRINGRVFRADALENVLVFLFVKAAQWICAQDISFVRFG